MEPRLFNGFGSSEKQVLKTEVDVLRDFLGEMLLQDKWRRSRKRQALDQDAGVSPVKGEREGRIE